MIQLCSMESDIYSVRSGEHPSGGSVDFHTLRDFVIRRFEELRMRGYFHEKYGFIIEKLLQNPSQFEVALGNLRFDFFTELIAISRKGKFKVINQESVDSLDDIFDLIEYIYSVASKPVIDASPIHQSIKSYDKQAAEAEIRTDYNKLLPYYEEGWELGDDGKVRCRPPSGLETLISNPLPDDSDIADKSLVLNAIRKFHSRESSQHDRRSAIREVGDIFEKYRSQSQLHLTSKVENELFTLLNQFGIRHMDNKQHTGYPEDVYYPWIFYYLLAALNALGKLMARERS